MERPMNHSVNQARISSDDVPVAEPAPFSAFVVEKVITYLSRLGLSDREHREQLAHDCLNRARRRIGRGSEEELVRRALEEVQRRFDHGLARALRLPPSKDGGGVAAARAAFLMAEDRFSADSLLQSAEPPAEIGEALQRIAPHPTPPEANLAMAEQPMRFWLFKSTHKRS
jgi:hypothetical protein